MDMQYEHGHAAWIWTCSMSMEMQNVCTWTYTMKIVMPKNKDMDDYLTGALGCDYMDIPIYKITFHTMSNSAGRYGYLLCPDGGGLGKRSVFADKCRAPMKMYLTSKRLQPDTSTAPLPMEYASTGYTSMGFTSM